MEPDKEKWYFKTPALVIALLTFGPFALPLLWLNPRFKLLTKILLTTVILAATYLMGIALKASLKMFNDSYQQLMEMSK